MTKQPDLIAARELALFAENDGGLYQRRALPIIANLARKIAAGTFDGAKAVTLWGYLADDAAKEYVRQFSPMTPFDKATRRAAAILLGDGYADAVAESAEEIRNSKRWTLAAVKAANAAAGHFFFSRETMRFFGDTMASFKVVCKLRNAHTARRAKTLGII